MKTKPFIRLATPSGEELISVDEIIFICSIDKTSCFTLERGEKKTHKISIKRVEELLNQSFFVRCHQRYIVNIYKIKEVLKSETGFVLINGTQLPVSRTYREQFRHSLEQFSTKMQ